MTTSPFTRGVIAVIRADSFKIARTIMRGLTEAPLAAMEITLTVPDAFQLISEGVKRRIPLGVGTVLNVEDCQRAIDLGAQFIVSPHLDEEIVATCIDANIYCIPGVLTPSETQRALRVGAPAVKIFPVKSVGGLDYIKTLLEPFPNLPYVVSGGIGISDVAEYLDRKCLAVCLGKSIIDQEAAARGDEDGVTIHAKQVLQAISTSFMNREAKKS